MKINWGTGIAIFYTIFAVTLLFAVVRSTHYDHSLVSEQYYADDQNYQKHYDKLVNASHLKEDLQIWNKKQAERIELQFPKDLKGVAGEVYFFCPSSSKKDFKLKVQPDKNNLQMIPTEGLKKGLWKVKVDWTGANKAFYKEAIITI